VTHSDRLDHLYKLLKARTKHGGEPLPNFGPNVAAIRAEIEKLEERLTAIALLEGGE
jgi:hypothetical protein